MKQLFEKQTADEFIARINKLTPQTPAQWGKMNVAQMLAHAQVALKTANGTLKPESSPLLSFVFGKYFKKKILGPGGFAKNSPTFKEAVIKDEKIFENEKSNLIALLESFQKKGKETFTHGRHPFFGNMSPEDWNTLQVKHLDHHLSQFGV